VYSFLGHTTLGHRVQRLEDSGSWMQVFKVWVDMSVLRCHHSDLHMLHAANWSHAMLSRSLNTLALWRIRMFIYYAAEAQVRTRGSCPPLPLPTSSKRLPHSSRGIENPRGLYILRDRDYNDRTEWVRGPLNGGATEAYKLIPSLHRIKLTYRTKCLG
jgi:hypothetical protein